MNWRRLTGFVGALGAIASMTWSGAAGPTTGQNGALTGLVTDGTNGAPLAFARIEIAPATGSARPAARLEAWSSGDGSFAIANVPPAEYFVAAFKPGYAVSYYSTSGSTTRGPGERLVVPTGRDMRISLPVVRGGVISGRVFTPFGRPAFNAQVDVRQTGARPDTPNPFDVSRSAIATTADGEYRAYGLAPGDYQVSATTWDSPAALAASGSRMHKIVRAFYGGVRDPDTARTITLEPGSEVIGIDIALQLQPLFRLTGRITGIGVGEHPYLTLTPSVDVPSSFDQRADGTFMMDGVPPGRYTIRGTLQNQSGLTLWTTVDVVVRDQDISDLLVPMHPTMTVTGSVRSEKPLPTSQLRILLRAVSQIPSSTPSAGVVGPDGTFSIRGLTPGVYEFVGSGSRSVVASLDGQPLPGKRLEIAAGQNVSGVIIEIR